jgi:hypothetical protein
VTRRNVTPETVDPRSRFGLYRLCDCPTCGGRGQVLAERLDTAYAMRQRCPDCRGEGRVREEVASCETPEAVGVALVTLAREGEWDECPLGLLDRLPECEECGGDGWDPSTPGIAPAPCATCKGSGRKPRGTWLILPWLPSARNVRDAARTLGKEGARKRTRPQSVI